MTHPVFFVAHDELVGSDVITLSGDEGRHASVVRRLRSGETLQLTDGRGLLVEALVSSADRASLTLEVSRRVALPRPVPTVTVVQAIPKGDRGELAVELMTEVGVDVVVPWSAARCVARWRADRATKGHRRWQQAAEAASKQSRRTWWPEITSVATTEEVQSLVAQSAQAFVLHEQATMSLPSVLPVDLTEILVVVGPEGGITDEEIAALTAAGARPARLGPTVLRTSTAGAVAVAVTLSSGIRWSTNRDEDA